MNISMYLVDVTLLHIIFGVLDHRRVIIHYHEDFLARAWASKCCMDILSCTLMKVYITSSH